MEYTERRKLEGEIVNYLLGLKGGKVSITHTFPDHFSRQSGFSPEEVSSALEHLARSEESHFSIEKNGSGYFFTKNS